MVLRAHLVVVTSPCSGTPASADTAAMMLKDAVPKLSGPVAERPATPAAALRAAGAAAEAENSRDDSVGDDITAGDTERTAHIQSMYSALVSDHCVVPSSAAACAMGGGSAAMRRGNGRARLLKLTVHMALRAVCMMR
jgi:hypothetical protein